MISRFDTRETEKLDKLLWKSRRSARDVLFDSLEVLAPGHIERSRFERRLGTNAAATGKLLKFLVGQKLAEHNDDGTYSLTKDGFEVREQYDIVVWRMLHPAQRKS